MKRIIILCGTLILLPLFLLMTFDALTSDLISARLMKKNPQRKHTVEVVKNTRQNVWYRIKLDGELLYTTPRFYKRMFDYREEVIWSKDGKRFLFEVAETPIYGYDIKEERPLTPEELYGFETTPFMKLGYMAEIPYLPPEPEPAVDPVVGTAAATNAPGTPPKSVVP